MEVNGDEERLGDRLSSSSSLNSVSLHFPVAKDEESQISEKYCRLDVLNVSERATIYRGKNIHTDRLVAIKDVQFNQNDGGVPACLVREVGFMRQISGYQQESIVRLLDIFIDDESIERPVVTMVMDYYQTSLTDYINKMAISTQMQSHLFMQLLDSVGFLHNQNIIHRHISPDHLLLNPVAGIIKLTGFKRARPVSENERMSPIPDEANPYQSPELLYGCDLYSAKVDVWSCGCVLAFIHLRRDLFNGGDRLELLHDILNKLGSSDLCQTLTSEHNHNGSWLYECLCQLFKERRARKLPETLVGHPLENVLAAMLNLNYHHRPTIAEVRKACTLIKERENGTGSTL